MFGLPAQIETPTTPHALPDVMTSSQGKIYDDKGAPSFKAEEIENHLWLVGWGFNIFSPSEVRTFKHGGKLHLLTTLKVFENLRRCCDIQYNF